MSGKRRKNLYGFEVREHDRRRVPENTPRKCHEIQQMWQRTHEIIRLALLGYKNVEIAKTLGITPQCVSDTLNSDLGMQKLSRMREERDKEFINVSAEVAKLYPRAIECYRELLESQLTDPELKKRVADTVLMDIGGHRAPTKVQGQFAHAHLSRDDIEAIKERGRKAAMQAGHLVGQGANGERSDRKLVACDSNDHSEAVDVEYEDGNAA